MGSRHKLSLGKKGVSRQIESKKRGRRPKKPCSLDIWRQKSKAQALEQERAENGAEGDNVEPTDALAGEGTAREKPNDGEEAAARTAAEVFSDQNEDPNLSSSSSFRGKRGESPREERLREESLPATRGGKPQTSARRTIGEGTAREKPGGEEAAARTAAEISSDQNEDPNLSSSSSFQRHGNQGESSREESLPATRESKPQASPRRLAGEGTASRLSATRRTKPQSSPRRLPGEGTAREKPNGCGEAAARTAAEILSAQNKELEDDDSTVDFGGGDNGFNLDEEEEGGGVQASLSGGCEGDSRKKPNSGGGTAGEQSQSSVTTRKPRASPLRPVDRTSSHGGEAATALDGQEVGFKAAALSSTSDEDREFDLSSSPSFQRRGKPVESTREQSMTQTLPLRPVDRPPSHGDEAVAALDRPGVGLPTALGGPDMGWPSSSQRPADMPPPSSVPQAPGPDAQLDASDTNANGIEGAPPRRMQVDTNSNRLPSVDEGDSEASTAGDADENDVGPLTDADTLRQDLEAEIAARFDLSDERRKKAVDVAYRVVRQLTGDIGGNGQGAAMYGEMIQSSCQKALDILVKLTGLGPDSRIIDIGCGRGKPSLHAELYARVEFSFGIELDPCRVFLANIILKNIIKKARKNTDLSTITNVSYQLGDISEARSLDPFTHVWMFDVA